jgi:hypothetical protein
VDCITLSFWLPVDLCPIRLTTELADSEQFQAAYYSLSDEVKSLIARNELAEDEAEQLSKFNAEILGHHNPAQRIMYVDRIRRELAEIKHVRLACPFVFGMLRTCKRN